MRKDRRLKPPETEDVWLLILGHPVLRRTRHDSLRGLKVRPPSTCDSLSFLSLSVAGAGVDKEGSWKESFLGSVLQWQRSIISTRVDYICDYYQWKEVQTVTDIIKEQNLWLERSWVKGLNILLLQPCQSILSRSRIRKTNWFYFDNSKKLSFQLQRKIFTSSSTSLNG